MKYEIAFNGKIRSKDWPHFSWSVDINGFIFTYKTGLAHSTNKYRLDDSTLQNKRPEDSISLDNIWVHKPCIDDVLECLFSDEETGSRSFYDFCSDFGYSNDSIKAFELYKECIEAGLRLRRALGAEFKSELDRIQKRIVG